jgi:GrpB-like predicted nucleotidyltransferase (UPF0157 family)
MKEVDEQVSLSPYREEWPGLFAAERARLAATLQLSTEAFEHIGSTAIPSLVAKPILDIMLGVQDLTLARTLCRRLSYLDYEDLGEVGVPGRLYYRRRDDCGVNLHVVEFGGAHWLNNIALRNFLRANPAACKRYEAAKLAAFAGGSKTLLAYSQSKAPVIEALLKQALSGIW